MDGVILQSVFYEVAALLALAAAAGFVGTLLRQPLIVSFIAVGVVAGPSVLDIIQSGEEIAFLSELGIAVLLFLVGIKLDIALIRALGPVALLTGLGQIGFTALLGFPLALALGFDAVTSLAIAAALTFSSTIVVVKLLSDKREIESLHGRVALGILIVQDIVVVVAMIALSTIGIGAGGEGGSVGIAEAVGGGVLLLGTVVLFVRVLATPLTARLARTPELLMCFALALATAFAAASDFLGFGKELGGLLAGVALASTPYREAISSRLAPLRDFLLLFFFVSLGSGLDLAAVGDGVAAALVLAAFVLVGKPLVVVLVMAAMGYRKRTGFLTGVTGAQISEFSLILMAMAASLGIVGADVLGLVTLVGMITIAASTYMMTHANRLYGLVEPLLGAFERKGTPREAAGGIPAEREVDVLLFGLGRFGGAIAQRLVRDGLRVIAVDFNPQAVRAWRGRGIEAVYGDALDPEFVAALPLPQARWAVSTVPEHDSGLVHEDSRLTFIQALADGGFAGNVAVTSHRTELAEGLRAAGADLVLEPFQDAADRAVELLVGDLRPERLQVVEPGGQQEIAD